MDLPIFYPARGALVFMDSLLGQALLVAPAALTGAGAAALYNLAVLGTLALAGLAAAALWRAGGGGTAAAGFCALLLLGSPFTGWQLGLLNQISPPWVVLLIAALYGGWHRFVTDGRAAGWWWAAAACLVAQAAWGWYGFADAVFVAGVALAAGVWRARRRGALRALARAVVLPALVAALGVGALAWPYLRQHDADRDYERSLREVRLFSADAHDFVHLGTHRATPRDWLGRGETTAARALRDDRPALHPGWITLALALVGMIRWRHLPPRQRGLGLLVTAIGACGLVMAMGDSVGVPPDGGPRLPLPFGVLHELLVPFRAFRAPVRFAFLATIAMTWWATAGAYGVWPRPHARWRRFALPAVWALLWLESAPVGMVAAPVDPAWRTFADLPGPLLTLPAPIDEQHEDAREVAWMHRAVASGRPVTGGVSGWAPPATHHLRARLAACESGREDPAQLLGELWATGVVAAELAVGTGDAPRVAYWDSTLRAHGLHPRDSGPGFRLYERRP